MAVRPPTGGKNDNFHYHRSGNGKKDNLKPKSELPLRRGADERCSPLRVGDYLSLCHLDGGNVQTACTGHNRDTAKTTNTILIADRFPPAGLFCPLSVFWDTCSATLSTAGQKCGSLSARRSEHNRTEENNDEREIRYHYGLQGLSGAVPL